MQPKLLEVLFSNMYKEANETKSAKLSMISFGSKYGTKSCEIAETVDCVEVPVQAKEDVLCILSIPSVVCAYCCQEPTSVIHIQRYNAVYSCLVCIRLSFLFTDGTFVKLLSVDPTMDALQEAYRIGS
ncbi:hypothetical protein G6F42_009180 [Rhizopus arrhizus]|nr:hypothetical protein G6F42_009180 [Rhizopus arrhizus]